MPVWAISMMIVLFNGDILWIPQLELHSLLPEMDPEPGPSREREDLPTTCGTSDPAATPDDPEACAETPAAPSGCH